MRHLHWSAETLCVFIDICSSTSILERCSDLGIEDNWGNLILDLYDYIESNTIKVCMNSHKFLGDGWIVFIDPNINWKILFSFLQELAVKYIELYNKYIKEHMYSTLENIGLTIGLHKGTLFIIDKELFGMPLNIASRLQGSLRNRDNDTPYANMVMVLKQLYKSQSIDLSRLYPLRQVKRTLKNLWGNTPQQCIEISLF
jgi:hypothetical protein